MSLLKALQHCLTSVSVPWVPSPYPNGLPADQREAGADTGPINRLVGKLQRGATLAEALSGSDVPEEAQEFIRSTFDTIRLDKPHITAAAFTFGREHLIPEMFREIVHDLRDAFARLALFEHYLERHIEVDDDTHGPMALRMLEDLLRG